MHSPMRSHHAALLALLSLAIPACAADASANPAARCDDAGLCGASLVCHRGFCVADLSAVCADGDDAPCWEGDNPGFAAIGVCHNGVRACVGGVWGGCIGQRSPTAEICNELDDDCDGQTDELDEPACDTGLLGLCAAGALECRAGVAACVAATAPADEACNALDDDCDGAVDEANDLSVPCYPGGARGCVRDATGAYACDGVCASGMTTCSAGAMGCLGAITPSSATDAICDGLDDDCDGAVDEDCACAFGATQACYSGPAGTAAVGPCRAGIQACIAGHFGDCVGEVVPVTEACGNAGVDDDCSGVPDNVVGLGVSCVVGVLTGVCTAGVLACTSGGSPTCTPRIAPGSLAEVCNRLDDNCDGVVDDGFDLLANRDNCGACGNACDPSRLCTNGVCCALGRTNCAGACEDTEGDRNNCGGCGIVCSSPDRDCCSGSCGRC